MNFKPSWSQVALLGVLLGAIIVANLVAPGVVGTITSLVSTVFGAVFVNMRQPEAPKPEGTPAPVLSLVPPAAEKEEQK